MKNPLKTALLSGLLALLCSPAVAFDSGLYFDPGAPGHGFALVSDPEGKANIVWFSYSPANESTTPAQAWFVSENFEAGEWSPVYRPLAFFPSRMFDLGDPVGEVRLSPTASGVRLDYRLFEWPWQCQGVPLPGPALTFCAGSLNLVLLAQ